VPAASALAQAGALVTLAARTKTEKRAGALVLDVTDVEAAQSAPLPPRSRFKFLSTTPA
jgi:hypothetical protein